MQCRATRLVLISRNSLPAYVRDASHPECVRSPEHADEDAVMRELSQAVRPDDAPLHAVARLHDPEDPGPGPCRRSPPPGEDGERDK